MALALIIVLPFLGICFSQLMRSTRSYCALGTALTPIMALGLLLAERKTVFSGQVRIVNWPWLSDLGLDLSLRLDGLSFLFALLILGIGLLVILYARYYLSESDPPGRFFGYFLAFMSSMLGVVLSENLLLMLMFWELTSLSSFLLIGFWNHRRDARRGARMALAVTGGGGLALLAGILLIGHIVGSFELTQVLAAGDTIRAHALYPLALILVLLGVFTKSAQFPFHFWLPRAMAAPTPVSAFLHSATMVKAGVFLLARLYPALSGTDWWFFLVGLTGMATLLLGAVMALLQHDLKGVLAYSTISHLGLITLLFGLDSDFSQVAAIFHIINHATFKASLFMAAGIIDHETGTRDIRQLHGMWRYMPHSAALAIVASLSMAGVPLLNGFLSKEMFFAETLGQHLFGSFGGIIPVLATLAGAFSVAYSLRFIHDVFFNGKPVDLPIYPPHEPPRYMRIPVEVLVLICLLVGIVPGLTVAPLLNAAGAASLNGPIPPYSLSIWHGFNTPLLMSFIALTGGGLIYFLRNSLFRWHESLPQLNSLEIFEHVQRALAALARKANKLLDNGSLQRYLVLVLLSALTLVAVALLPLDSLTGSVALTQLDGITILGFVIMALASMATVVFQRHRLVALMPLSAVGLMVSLAFLRYSAPDLALTQLSVEVVTIILLILSIFFLPIRTPIESTRFRRGRDLLVALACGVMMSLLAYAVMTRPYDSIATFFLENSVSGGGGTNVVNVILVDFRGFDTLGEICVLAIAGVGIYGLLHALRLPFPKRDYGGRTWSIDSHPMILDDLARQMLPMALLISVFIFMRGHNLPGGGFIAGLITSIALILQYISHGVIWTQERQPLSYHGMAGWGICIAGLTGLSSLAFGHTYLTSAFRHFHLPLIGEFELATAMLFDLGVYLAVVGATMLILSNMGHVGQDECKEVA
ncbi:monovalent cation/H+ antiporter subunit A [Azomonas macrocytogenes]|uniref:Multicomponent K+:H+ antiporter subunit A n=1 Tax=Azomonas macrocytogenes TaxID=69962 RepID=A0A839T1K1_AZOMA|nr:monovalent cation/H+ antiporter subunit A [Azomonas macrocytogenes]MBB3102274.1 multicomponent K+:H+ antiporter subunit A [Azomonas macrocytogenes]